MADIKQAAKWMKTGKKIKRSCWNESSWLKCTRTGKTKDSSGQIAYFTIEELLAEDWEIAK